MPSFEDVQKYLNGAVRMMLGKSDGLRMLDCSIDGFWNSFFAMVVALPALMIGWVSLANDLQQASESIGSRFSILLRIALIDVATWTGPIFLLALIIGRTPIASRFVAIVVSGNWASAVIVWFMLPAALLRLMIPQAQEAASILSLLLFAISMLMTWRVTNVAIGKGPAIASVVFVAMLFASMAIMFTMQAALGLSGFDQPSTG